MEYNVQELKKIFGITGEVEVIPSSGYRGHTEKRKGITYHQIYFPSTGEDIAFLHYLATFKMHEDGWYISGEAVHSFMIPYKKRKREVESAIRHVLDRVFDLLTDVYAIIEVNKKYSLEPFGNSLDQDLNKNIKSDIVKSYIEGGKTPFLPYIHVLELFAPRYVIANHFEMEQAVELDNRWNDVKTDNRLFKKYLFKFTPERVDILRDITTETIHEYPDYRALLDVKKVETMEEKIIRESLKGTGITSENIKWLYL